MMDLVINTITRYVPLTASDRKLIQPFWKDHAFAKNEVISKPGSVEKRFYIVRSGVQKIFFEHDLNDHILGFSYDGSWCGDYTSFVTQKPGSLSVQALTDSVLCGIDHKDLMYLFEELPIMERWGRLILEELLVGRAQREIEILSLSAEDRFRKVMDRSAHLLQLVSQKDIASYLGMTPETFSRIRAKVQ